VERILLAPRSLLDEQDHHDWTGKGRHSSGELKIKVSAQFFIRAYQKYNITSNPAGLRQLGDVGRDPPRLIRALTECERQQRPARCELRRCAGPTNHANIDLLNVWLAARLVGAEKVDKKQVTEAEYQLGVG